MSDVGWIPWAVALGLVRQSKNCDADRAGALLFDELRVGRLAGAGETSLECPAENKVFPEPAPDWQPQFIEQSKWSKGEWLPDVPALKFPDRVISNLHVDDVALARLIGCAAPAPPAAAKASSKKRAAPRSEFESPARALKFNRKWKYQPKALRERMKRELLAKLWDARGPDGRREMARQWDINHDPAGEPDQQKMFDLLDRRAALKVKIAAASDDASLANFENELAHVDADIFESVNKPDDNVLRDTHRFLEIAEAVARLNPPLTAAKAMERLIKSFEEGEFERDGESGVYQGGKRLSREFQEKAKAIPEAERGNVSNPNVYRISKAMLTDWGLRWGFRLAPGFTTMTAAQEQSAAPTPSANTVDCPIAAPTSATPEIKLKWSRAAERPVYEEPVTYFADKMPGQFKEWAQKQHNGDVIITVVIAEDAMRGPRDKDGNRTGGLLASGKGLSRDTIRAWVAALPDEWRAHQGEPPSRTK